MNAIVVFVTTSTALAAGIVAIVLLSLHLDQVNRLGALGMTAAVLMVALLGISGVLLTGLRAALLPARAMIFTLLSSLLTGGLSVAAALWLMPDARGLLLASVVGLGASTLLLLRHGATRIRWRPDWTALSPALRYSAPLCLSSIGILVGQNIDRFFVAGFCDLHQTGIYGFATRMATIAVIPLLGLQMAISPLVFAHPNDPATPHALARGHLLATSLGAMAVLWLSLAGPLLVHLFGTPDYEPAIRIVPILATSFVLAQMIPFSPGLWMPSNTWLLAMVNLMLGMVNPIISSLLTPRLGIEGAAIANLTASACCWITIAWLGQRFYRVPHPWLRMMSIWLIVLPIAYSSLELDRSSRLLATVVITLVGGSLIVHQIRTRPSCAS